MAAPAQSPVSSPPSFDQQVATFLVPVDGCPSRSSFRSLLSHDCKDVELVAGEMLEWSRKLFIEHDRALGAGELFQCIKRALDACRTTTTTNTDVPGGATVQAGQEWIVKLHEQMNQYPFDLIGKVDVELRELQRICGPPQPDSSWTVINPGTDEAKISTWYRSEPGGGLHAFLVSGEVKAPLFNCVAMVKEATLFPRWLPAVKSTTMTPLDGSRYRMQLQLLIGAVWPLADREAVVYGYGDVIDHAVGVYFRSQGENEIFTACSPSAEDVTVLPVDPSQVRVNVAYGGFWFEKVDENTTLVRALFNVDPKLPVIPYYFLNLMSSKFCGAIIEMMRSRAPNLLTPICGNPTIYKIRMNENARVYEEITRRIQQADEAKAKKQQEEANKM